MFLHTMVVGGGVNWSEYFCRKGSADIGAGYMGDPGSQPPSY